MPDGLVLVDKPERVSSHDVVLAVRAAFGERRVGHAGTLDPFATGLLVILVGRATRLLQYLPGEPKVYDTTIAFGTETETDDLLGSPVRHAAPPSLDRVRAEVATSFTGPLQQVPPSYSAKRIGGRRAYALARAGAEFTIEPAAVRVHSWTEHAWEGAPHGVASWSARLECSGGTYVRALARDLGRALGSAAHVAALRRVRSGSFDVAAASTIADLRAGIAPLRPVLDALPGVARQVLSADQVTAISRGQGVEAAVEGAAAALVNAENGALVAYAVRSGDRWQPRAVMRPVASDGGE